MSYCRPVFICILLIVGFPSLSLASATYKSVDHCDIPVGTIRSLPAKSVDECTSICTKESTCTAITFISGWNRCVLKAKPSPQRRITFYSGVVRDGIVGIGAAQLAKLKASNLKDTDLPGSDLKQVGQIKSAGACRDSCATDSACIAFTYIDGYSTCWHKGAKLRFVQKVFTCAVQSRS